MRGKKYDYYYKQLSAKKKFKWLLIQGIQYGFKSPILASKETRKRVKKSVPQEFSWKKNKDYHASICTKKHYYYILHTIINFNYYYLIIMKKKIIIIMWVVVEKF